MMPPDSLSPSSAFRFDPAGYRRLSTGSDGMRKCKVRICELMTAGVVLSRLIATKQKLKFVLGRAAGPPYVHSNIAQSCCFHVSFIQIYSSLC